MTISRKPVSISEGQAAVSLLFAEGNRPDIAAICDHVAAIEDIEVSLEVAQLQGAAPTAVWVELLSSGLTFDLTGLDPGLKIPLPPCRSASAPPRSDLDIVDAITIVPGPHLSGGRGMAPVLRTLAYVAASLSELANVEAVAWHAAQCWCEPAAFRKGVFNWMQGGVFPGLMLTSLSIALDKGMHSTGLALFTGQELRIEPELAADPTAATKLALRLFDYLADRGRIARDRNAEWSGRIAAQTRPFDKWPLRAGQSRMKLVTRRSYPAAPPVRPRLPFRRINRRGEHGYRAAMQRHHLLPLQLLSERSFGKLFDWIGRDRVGFDDFRCNGLLLPASEPAAVRLGLPLHRGPHCDYNKLVSERVGQIEQGWASGRLRAPEAALEQALMRLSLLQRALRRRLLSERRRFRLNRLDPLGAGRDFSDLDAMAEELWRQTAAVAA